MLLQKVNIFIGALSCSGSNFSVFDWQCDLSYEPQPGESQRTGQKNWAFCLPLAFRLCKVNSGAERRAESGQSAPAFTVPIYSLRRRCVSENKDPCIKVGVVPLESYRAAAVRAGLQGEGVHHRIHCSSSYLNPTETFFPYEPGTALSLLSARTEKAEFASVCLY